MEITSAVRESRKSGRTCQRNFSAEAGRYAANAGLDIDKNAVQRIESGKRFVTDIELKVIARCWG